MPEIGNLCRIPALLRQDIRDVKGATKFLLKSQVKNFNDLSFKLKGSLCIPPLFKYRFNQG